MKHIVSIVMEGVELGSRVSMQEGKKGPPSRKAQSSIGSRALLIIVLSITRYDSILYLAGGVRLRPRAS